jgi:hypothetical protein
MAPGNRGLRRCGIGRLLSTLASTIRTRKANACALFGRRAQASKNECSAAV